MSDQYEQAVLQRNRYASNTPNWLTVIIVGLAAIGSILIIVSIFSGSSSTNDITIEFQKTLFEQSNELFYVNTFLLGKTEKNRRYFSKLNKYANQINHRFEIISEFIDDNNLDVDALKFTKVENRYRLKFDSLLDQEKELIQYHHSLLKMQQTLPKLLALNTDVNDLMLKGNPSNNHIYFVTRQLFLLERIASNIHILASTLNESSYIVTSADRIGRDMSLLIRVYSGLLKGDYKMNVSKINSLKVRQALQKVAKLAKSLSKDVSLVLKYGADAYQFVETRHGLQRDSLKLHKGYQELFFVQY